ncbi:MAG: cadherin repeat domain-containing protein, partial [Candidatus Gracilibacteria bacterium]|nr:cadherin repeat domain-containing protein [Candidatus Gracilibacteria bacterium]
VYVASYNSDALEILELHYDTTSPYIQPINPLNYGTANNLLTFSQALGFGNQGTVTYQISKNNGTTWYYWNGSTWIATTGGVSDSSSASVINSNLSSFNLISGGTGLFTFRAYLTSNGLQKVELDQVQVTASDPASPGGITGMALWFKSNKGTNSITDGASITSWTDQSGNGYNATSGIAPTYINNDANNLNYNPLISFNGTNQYLQNLNNGAYSKTYFMVIVPNNQVDGTMSEQIPFGRDCTSGVLSSGTCGLTYAGLTFGAFTIAMNDEVITHAIGSSTNRRSSQIGAYSYQAQRPMLMSVNENNAGTGTDIFEKGIQVNNTSVNTYQTLSTADFRIGGSIYTADPTYYNGKIAEIIDYSSRVTDTDRQKIESYLAVKYGITLSGGTMNYIASDGTIIWNYSTAGSYIYNILGIGRDDSSSLGQVKSKSSNDSGILTVEAIGEGTNMSNSFVDISNKEFFMVSNNNGSNTWTQTGNPTGYEILTRKWKVQEVGDVGTLNLDFDVGNSNFDIPIYNSGSLYYFVYDSNNNGLLSDETPIAMTNTAGSIWRVSGLNLSNGQIFTLAGVTSVNNVPTNITLSNNTINENVAAGSIIGTLSTTDADSGDTHTYSFVVGIGDTDNSSFTLSGNILKINESPDYEIKNTYYIRIQTDDGHGGQFQKQFTININNVGEAINSIIDFETPGKYTVTSGIWSRVTTNPYELLYSIQSNNLGAVNSQSCFEVDNTFYGGTGTISFYYYVSSQAGGDYLRFYIDNVEQQNWSGTVPWTLYTNNTISAGNHIYKWCYIKDGSINSGTDNAYVDYITFMNNNDLIPPTITSTNYSSGYLLPGGNHNLIIYYNDASSGINTGSSLISLYKWNGTAWGSDISSTGLNLAGKIITTTQATYPTNNLSYGKYYYNFQISDNMANTSSTGVTFYIDEPEIILNTGSLDLGNLSYHDGLKFSSGELIVTIKTLGAPFQLQLLKNTDLVTGSGSIIIDWDGTKGVGYDKSPYTYVNKNIGTYPVIGTGALNINTNGDKNIYN